MIREAEVRALVVAFGVHVREHYRDGEPGNDRVLELLNALAITAATVLAGTGGDRRAFAFFFVEAVERQLAAHLEELAAEPAAGEPAPLQH